VRESAAMHPPFARTYWKLPILAANLAPSPALAAVSVYVNQRASCPVAFVVAGRCVELIT
jgi:hypothetical protein